jgi:hypothetical protein
VTGRRGKRSKQLLDDLKEMGEYWKYEDKALDGTVWTTGFARVYGHALRQTAGLMNAMN